MVKNVLKYLTNPTAAAIKDLTGFKGGEYLTNPTAAAMKNLPGFKKGGKVKKTGPIMAHKGEYVLPASVKPTKKQMSKVSKLRKRK
jgi:hypothetical protein